MHRHARPVVAVATLALGLAATITTALPGHANGLACGAVITTSTTLTHDLVCDGTTDGLVIGADNITLDLGGFMLSAPGGGLGSGVRAAQKSGVTVTNGTITGFHSGVVLDQAVDSTVTKVVSHANVRGVDIAGGTGILVSKSIITSNGGDGVRLGGTVDGRVTQNTLHDNVWGISASAAIDAVFDRNVVTGSRSIGITAFDWASGTTITQNKVSTGWLRGISVHGGSTGTLVLQNQTWSNGTDGIYTEGSTTVTKNLSTYNGQLGISAVGATDGGGNKAAYNGNPLQCVGVVCSAP